MAADQSHKADIPASTPIQHGAPKAARGLRVLICGRRDFGQGRRQTSAVEPAYGSATGRAEREIDLFARVLADLGEVDTIIHGGGSGAEKLAELWGARHGINTVSFQAVQYPYGPDGGRDRLAISRRNQRMLDEGRPDLVLVFSSNRSTQDHIKRAKNAMVPCILVELGKGSRADYRVLDYSNRARAGDTSREPAPAPEATR